MPISVVAHGYDNFTYIDETGVAREFNYAALVMLFELARASVLEQQLADEVKGVAELNDLLSQANKHAETLRVAKGKLSGTATYAIPADVKAFFQKHGIDAGASSQNKDKLEITIENLKAFIDTINTKSQRDMIRLSALLKKRDESYTLPSNTNKSIHDTNMSNISHL